VAGSYGEGAGMNTWADRLRLARLLVAPPTPEAHAGSPAAWRGGWAARLAGEERVPRELTAKRNRAAYFAAYAACGVAMEAKE
jgi:hypothetical protein